MKKIIIVLFLFVCLFLLTQGKEEYIIPDSAIRLRVIASSNTFEDQATKMEIKNNIETILQQDLTKRQTKEEATLNIQNNLPKIKTMLNNYNLDYKMNYGKNYFPEKTYKGVKYEEGMYESLVVTLGSGEGENWWCVLFPPLCFIDESKIENKENMNYAFFVKELFQKYM